MDATKSLQAQVAGDEKAASQLFPLVYERLRALAFRYMRGERPDHTLRPTDLVHEAYLRMVDNTRVSWQGKTHFFAMAAKQMRRILVDHARAHATYKRGGDLKKVTLVEGSAVAPQVSIDVLALDEALKRLGELSPRQADIVELRFFGGLSVRETAYALQISERTVKADSRLARAWLLRELDVDR